MSMHRRRIFLIRVIPTTLFAVWTGLCAGHNDFWAKVPNIFLDDVNECSLNEIDAPHKLRCLNACSLHSECKLACYGASTSKCKLFKASVTRFWNPQVSDITTTLDEFECFTSWVESNEITNRIIAIKASPVNFAYSKKEMSVDGYYCSDYFYHSEETHRCYYEIELEKISKISEIIIKNRDDDIMHGFLANIGVGNFSGDGDYSGYTHFGDNDNMPALGEIVTLKPPKPLYGKYISIESKPPAEYLTIAELKIIS